ncbi:FtsL-like putative cell division protein [Mucilaginibacter sp.]|uniref:FtsL-like putative cell division protein n=1 Tax=Mucilaginibacter sp. TaxID=1882438 RepID=UPI003D0D0605
MTNRLRTQIEEEEAEKKLVVEEKPVKEFPDNFLTQFLTKGILNAEAATKALPFMLFVALLGMIYIANRHLAERNIRDIDKISKEVKELSWDYKNTKAELAFKSTLTEVAKRTDTLGIKESLQPPQKLMAGEVKNEH